MVLSQENCENTARLLRESLHLKRINNISSSIKFTKKLENYINSPLEDMHTCYGPYKIFKQGMDQHTNLHKKLYELHKYVKTEYWQIVDKIVTETVKEPCFVQQVPTYRFGFPDNRWVGAYHLDSDFGHSKYELNVILALTRMNETSALQVEETPNSYKYKAMNLEKTEIILFNHIDRRHGCCLNREKKSVASIDFRCIPVRFAKHAFQNKNKTINSKLQLQPGAYFNSQIISPNQC
jgi:hypothetical protein